MDFKARYGTKLDKTSEFYVEPEEFEIVEVKGCANGCKRRHGTFVSNMVTNLSVIKSLELRENDTIVVGFPKSGTTWMEEIVWLLRNNLDFDRAKSEFHHNRIVVLDDSFSHNYFAKMQSPRVFKSHLPIHFLPANAQTRAKLVYIARNPKDLVVSFFNFYKTFTPDLFVESFEDMCELFVKGECLFGPWWDHVNRYSKLGEQIFFVHYEDMIEVNDVDIFNNIIEFFYFI